MAAPEFVPVNPMEEVRVYESPPRRPDPWMADRPGDVPAGQPSGPLHGSQGPDQGYALLLARRLQDEIQLTAGEKRDDVTAGSVAIALKRASLVGRAPVIHDLRVALKLFGYPDPHPPAELVELRSRLFAGVAHPHHYAELRRLVDAVPEELLRRSPDAVEPIDPSDFTEPLPH